VSNEGWYRGAKQFVQKIMTNPGNHIWLNWPVSEGEPGKPDRNIDCLLGRI